MKPPQKTVETVEQTGRKWPKSGPWTLEAKLRTRRPGVRIPHGVPIMAVTLWVIAIIAFLHPEGFEVYAPEGQIPYGVPSSSRTSYCSRRRFFSASSSLTHFVAPPPKTGPAFAGLRFCFISGGSRSFKRLLQVLRLPSPVAAVFAFPHPQGFEVYAPEG